MRLLPRPKTLRTCSLCALALTAAGCTEEPEKAVAQAEAPTESAAAEEAEEATKTPLGKGETPAEREEVDDDGVVRRGTALPEEEGLTQVSVADCVKRAEELDGKKVLIEGKVAKVCKKKGCWWSIQSPDDEGQTIRVTHKGYGFFVPSDIEGKDARAYGVLEVKKLSPEEAAHLAKDEGKEVDDPGALPTVELRLEASALEMKS